MEHLRALIDWPLRRPRAAVGLALGLWLLGGLGVSRLTLDTDVALAVRAPAVSALGRVRDRFGLDDRATILLEGPPAALASRAEAVAARLRTSPAIASVETGPPLGRADLVDRLAVPCGLLYLTPEALRERLSPDGMADQLDAVVERLGLPGLGDAEALLARDPLELYRPVVNRLARGGLRGGHVSDDGGARLVVVRGVGSSSDPLAARAVAAAIRGAIADVDGAGATGGYLVAEEAERTIRRDLTLSLSTSIFLALLLVGVGLRLGPGRTLMLVVPTLWGATVGIGAQALIDPRIPAMALGCAAVLIGLGIDFAIHLAGAASEDADRARTWRATVGRLALAATTSIAAFAAFGMASQAALRAMGRIAAVGIAACWLGAVLWRPGRWSGGARRPRSFGAVPLAAAARRRPGRALGLAGLLSLAATAVLLARPVGVEDDLRRLHAADSAPLAVQARIAARFGSAADPVLLLVEGDDALAACQRLEGPLSRLRDAGVLAGWASIAHVVPSEAEQRAALAALATLDPDRVARELTEAIDAAGLDPAAYADYVAKVRAAVARRAPLGLAELRERGLGPLVDRLAAPGAALLALAPVEAPWTTARRRALRASLDGALAQAGVRAAMTGMVLVAAESTERIADDFARVSLATLLAVLVVLALRFRRPGRVALVLLPAALGTLWTAAALAALGVRLNLFNLGVLPMVLAIGVDDGIHVVDAWLEGYADLDDVLATTGAAVALTSLTTMATFGSLALSANRGLASVGMLAGVGVGACLLATLVVLPPLLDRVRR